VWIDGGGVITSFVEAGLIDLVTVTRIPVLIGQGIPLFGALTADVRLDHVVTSSFESGVVQSTYRVA
jgi:dihydrofolate reductase